MLIYFVSLCLITASFSLIMGLFTYIRGKERLLSRIFSFLSLSIFVWCFGLGIEVISPSQELGFFWSRFLHMGVAFLTPTYLHVALILVNLDKKRKPILIVAYIWGFILCCCNLSNLLVESVSPKFYFNYYTEPGILYPFLLIQFFICMGYGFYVLFRSLKWVGGYKRNQIKFFIAGSFSAYIGGIPTYLPVFDIFVHPFTMLLLPVCYMLLAYAIVEHRLMDITFAFRGGLIFALYLIVVSIIFIPLIILAQNSLAVLLTLFILISFISPFAYRFLSMKSQHFVDRTLLKGKYDYQKELVKLSKNMVTILDLDKLLNKLLKVLIDILNVTSASIILWNENSRKFELKALSENNKNLSSNHRLTKNDALIKRLNQDQLPIVKEEIEREDDNEPISDIVQTMKDIDAEVIIPLIIKDRLIGLVNLGSKKNRGMFSQQDLDLLSFLANETAIAIENAYLYKDLKETQEKLRRVDRLRTAGTLAAGVAHEIRNPLTSIKTFFDLYPQRKDDEYFTTDFFNTARGEVDRITRLTGAMLNFTQSREPVFKEEDIHKTIDEALLMINEELSKKQIKLEKQYGPNLFLINADQVKIEEALINIILNAVQAIDHNQGKITISTQLVQRDNKGYLQIKIKDNGFGIDKENLETIFDPLYSSDPQKVGLGLTIANQRIEEHQGFIEVKSKLKKGSSFSIYLLV